MTIKTGTVLLFVASLLTQSVFAATADSALPASDNTPTAIEKTQKIEDLKDRLATKVAELRQISPRALFGTVKSTSLTTITVETPNKDMKIELNDDIKVIQMIKGKRTALTTDDVEKGDVVSVFGGFDSTLDILKAKVIIIENTPQKRVQGKITEVNKEDFSVTIMTPDGQTLIVDIESGTKTTTWGLEKGIQKAGFTRLTVGDMVHVRGKSVPKEDNRVSADKILDMGNFSGDPVAPTSTSTPTPTAPATPTPKK